MTAPLLTAAEAAELLRVGKSTVHALARRGELKSIVVCQGRERSLRRFRETDVQAYIDQHEE